MNTTTKTPAYNPNARTRIVTAGVLFFTPLITGATPAHAATALNYEDKATAVGLGAAAICLTDIGGITTDRINVALDDLTTDEQRTWLTTQNAGDAVAAVLPYMKDDCTGFHVDAEFLGKTAAPYIF